MTTNKTTDEENKDAPNSLEEQPQEVRRLDDLKGWMVELNLALCKAYGLFDKD